MKILVTCPPMLGTRDQFIPYMQSKGMSAYCAEVVQTLSEPELIELVPHYDGWIIGDDPATRSVLEAGKQGKLKAAVRWGIGVDNVDFEACDEFKIPITNTPGMFGDEVADIAVGYIVGLARYTFLINQKIREGAWPKNIGMSLKGKTVALVGYGDIGSNLAKRLRVMGMNVIAYDPVLAKSQQAIDSYVQWPDRLNEADFVVFTCSLNNDNRHMLNKETISLCKDQVRIVNVARGSLIDEEALIESLATGKVHSVALDVFEEEPLSLRSELRSHEFSIFGSHNSSNTIEAVHRTNIQAIDEMSRFLFGSV